jgi:hypothetical protein
MVFGRDGDVLSFLDSVQRAATSPYDSVAEPAQKRFGVSGWPPRKFTILDNALPLM